MDGCCRSLGRRHVSAKSLRSEFDRCASILLYGKIAQLIKYLKGPTVAAVMRQLAEEERKQLEANRDMSLDNTVTPSVLIATGITLENEQ